MVKTHPVMRVNEMIGELVDMRAEFLTQLDNSAILKLDAIISALRELRKNKLIHIKVG